MADDGTELTPEARNRLSAWKVAGWVCLAVITGSVLLCVVLAASRSTGLTRVTVTALDRDAEPRDHNIPFFKQKEALPDYQLFVVPRDGWRINLGTQLDRSAADGLEWSLSTPVSVSDIATVRLEDDDKLVSDAIAEVQITGESVTDGNYRFDFQTERSISVGVESFFKTPIGQAISAAFFIAVLVMLAGMFCG